MLKRPARGLMVFAVAAMLSVASCNDKTSPTAPTLPTPTPVPVAPPTSLTSVTPSEPIRNGVAQLLGFEGLGFRTGLVLAVTDPGGVLTTIPSGEIQNLLPASFRAVVLLSEPGAYRLIVRQSNGESSPAFVLDVRDPPSTDPQIGSVSPSVATPSAVAQVVTLAGVNFDPSLTVQIIDPDSTLTQLNRSNLIASTGSVIQFSMAFVATGNYAISLWTALGPASNTVIIQVR